MCSGSDLLKKLNITISVCHYCRNAYLCGIIINYKKEMKKYIWMPTAFFIVGLAFYVYYGITWNSWMENLPNILIYLVVVVALSWSLKRKEKFQNEREQLNDKEK